MSEDLALELGLIKYVHNVEAGIESRYPKLFEGLGKLSNYKVKIHVDENVPPVVQGSRRVPFALRDKVEKKLDELVNLDIIERVTDTPTSWVSQMVVVPKQKSDDIRICIDMRRPNEAVIRERYPIPTIDEVMLDMNQSTVFTKLDMNMGYHQIELDESSRGLTTFGTHKGLFRYKRLMFGISAAPEIYQNAIQQTLSGCAGVVNISDDILVHGCNVEEHDQRLECVLKVLVDRNITLNKNKCEFGMDKLVFMGHVLSKHGIGAEQSKIKAIVNAERPTDATEIRSFLGLATYCSRYIPDFETIAEPLRRLTKKSVVFNWGGEQEKAFNTLKEKLSSAPVLAYFNKDAPTQVIADASPVGLGAVLVQQQPDGHFRPVYYAARSLSDVERRYSQTEKEALALVWACERFKLYLIGLDFELLTDHQALKTIYGPRSTPSARIERWVLRLQQFRFSVKYIPGRMNIADVLSRLPEFKRSKRMNGAESYVRAIAELSVPKTMSAREVEQASREDAELRVVREAIKTGNFEGCDLAYRAVKDELTAVGHIVVRQTKLVIPSSLRQEVLKLAHQGHQGIVKTKARLREKVWWPGIDRQCEAFCKRCHGCQVVSQPNGPEAVVATPMPEGPWQDLALDFVGPMPTGEYLLVIVDYYSRYFVIKIMKSITTERLIEAVEETIDVFGIPYSVTGDNGPQLVSREFENYLERLNIRHRKTTPKWAQANGEVERQNRTLLKAMRIAHAEGKDWRRELRYFLRAYRTTPHCVTGVSPAELMFKRVLRTNMPMLRQTEYDGEVRDRERQQKLRSTEYANRNVKPKENIAPGDVVLMRQEKENKLSPSFWPTPVKVVDKKGTQVTVRTPEGNRYKRNLSHVKKYVAPELEGVSEGEKSIGESLDVVDRGESQEDFACLEPPGAQVQQGGGSTTKSKGGDGDKRETIQENSSSSTSTRLCLV
jgi:hypothetical protein